MKHRIKKFYPKIITNKTDIERKNSNKENPELTKSNGQIWKLPQKHYLTLKYLDKGNSHDTIDITLFPSNLLVLEISPMKHLEQQC